MPCIQNRLYTQAVDIELDVNHDSFHNELAQLLELCLTPGQHTVQLSQKEVDHTIQSLISVLTPFMRIGVAGISSSHCAVIDLMNDQTAHDFDIIFVKISLHDDILCNLLSTHGTTIIIDIKN